MKKAVRLLLGLLLGITGACGSATGSGGSGGSGGTGTGGIGTGGVGTGGIGTGGAANGGGNGSGGMGGSTGKAGAGGSGGGAGGSGGKGGAGGVGGASPCQAVLTLDRTCTTAADCFAGEHQTNCCGQRAFIGFNTAVQAQVQDLEAKCDATYPACGCAEGQPTTDDGSQIRFGATPGVTCAQGVCTTYVPDCGMPCASGTTCFSCMQHASTFAACTTMCAASSDCHDATLPLCQMGSSGNRSGMFCTAAGVACDTK